MAERATASGTAAVWFSHVPGHKLHKSTPTHWLTSRFHFNFASYHTGPEQFGVLRVINDDIVIGKSGFGTHPHETMEIFTYVLTGFLSHQDSMGSAESLGRGAVQYMSAGSGLTHSEMNREEIPTRFLQIWILPTPEGERVAPRYGSKEYPAAARANTLLPIIQNIKDAAADERSCKIHQDVNVYASELAIDAAALSYTLAAGRQVYMVNAEGSLLVELPEAAVTLHTRDGLKIKALDEAVALRFTAQEATESAHFLIIEMPLSRDL
eukprot:c2025_g1_i2.p1 GENE.c2025_g1_i2~~c2025_g1_i2.p1  ORF type:complete len:285 (-),score=45.28 c2025_g1_i2:374-1174(-)